MCYYLLIIIKKINMKKLEMPRKLVVNFAPSEKQMEVWNTISPNRCDKCGGKLVMRRTGFDSHGNAIHEPTCVNCGSTDIPEFVLMGGAAGGGKQTMLDSHVCTPFGFRKVRDLKIGSIITNPKTGGMQRVIWLHPVEKHDYYRVHFVDGTFTDCSAGHLWECHEAGKKYKRTNVENGVRNRVWSTTEMFQWYQNKKNGMYNGRHLIIPLTQPVKFTPGKGKLKISPYILGALIGDGCLTECLVSKECVNFTSADQEIIDRFTEKGYDMTHCSKKANTTAKQYLIHNKELVLELKKLGISGNNSKTHFIPQKYLYSSIEERIELMQGLIDTDGYVDKRGHITYTSISKQLAEDVAFIVRSLGGIATISEHSSGYFRKDTNEYVKCNNHYDVQIRTNINKELCGLTRKKNRINKKFNGGVSELGKRITDIEYIGIREGRCITVSDPSGLYICDNFTVTHNSYLGSAWLIINCITFPKILMVVARLTLKDLRATTWSTILRILDLWGFKEDENYHINNQYGYIDFWNGSRIMMVELSPSLKDPDYNNLGSLEITGAFIDEVSEVPEKAVEVLGSRIRYRIADTFVVGKLVMSTNPVQNYIKTRFVSDDDGNPVHLAKGDRFLRFTVFDNPDEKFRVIYFNKLRKIKDKVTRDRLAYGNWDYSETNKMSAYWNFSGERHLVMGLFRKKYDRSKPIILSLDFNVKPYMSCEVMQVDYTNKKVYVIKEFIGTPEKELNNTPAFSRFIASEIMSWGHYGGIIVTGDPAGLARSTQTEKGTNNFTIAVKYLTTGVLKPKVQLLAKQPAQVSRLEFINEVFNGYDGWEILVELTCRKLTADFMMQKKNEDGTKEKLKVQDPNGGKSEKYGHCSDCFDYFMIKFLGEEYEKFQTAEEVPEVTTVPDGEIVYNAFDY